MAPNDLGGPFTLVQLKMLVPERIGAWKRTTVNVPLESSVPASEPTVVFGYRQGKRNTSLTVSDAGADSAAGGAAQWKGPPNRRQTDSGSEYVYREGRHTVREIERRDSSVREVMLILANGLVIAASGDGVDMAALKALAAGIPIANAEALVRPAR